VKKIVTTAALVLIALATSTALGALPASPAEHGRCFPAKEWDGSERAPDGVRPCVQVRRVYEDGSFKFAVLDANGTVRYTAGVGALDR
jgi:hypothetical protein